MGNGGMIFLKYQERRDYIRKMYEPVVFLFSENEDSKIVDIKIDLSDWDKIKRISQKLKKREAQAVYIAVTLAGKESEELRSYAKVTNKLANVLTHKRTATKYEMLLCTFVALAWINFIGVLEEKF